MTRPERRPLLPLVALGAAVAVASAVLLHFGRGLTFYYDEWNFVLNRVGHDPDVFLRPHNEHNSFLPVLIYKLLFETAGLDRYGAYRVVHVGLMEAVAVLVYLYARPRLGAWWALGPAVALVLVGQAPDYVLQTFELSFSLSLAAGVGALIAFDRGSRLGDAIGSGLLVAALFSSSLGIPIAIGATVEVLLRPDRRRRVWLLAPPVLLYGAWYLEYHANDVVLANAVHAPRYVEEMYVSGVGALTSLSAGAATIAVALVGLAVVAAVGQAGLRPRFWAVAATGVAFWFLTAVSRYGIAPPNTGRYLFPSAVFVALLACEVFAGRLAGHLANRRGAAIGGVVLALLLVNDWGLLRANQGGIPDVARHMRAELGALELVRSRAPADYRPDPGRAPDVTAAKYFGATERYGSSPADSPGKIAGAPAAPRESADRVLGEVLRLGFAPAARLGGDGRPAEFEAVDGTASRDARGCLRFRPAGAGAALRLTVPSGTVGVAADEAAVAGTARRFADGYAIPAGSVPPGAAGTLALPPDAARERPWGLSLSSASPFTVCVLR